MPYVHEQGNIYFYPDFTFHDGDKSNKLIILLTKSTCQNKMFVFCITTSQQKFRCKSYGCNRFKAYFFIPEEKDIFKKDTWLLLDDLYSFKPEKIKCEEFEKKVRIIGKLKKGNLSALIGCIKKIDDIPDFYLNKII